MDNDELWYELWEAPTESKRAYRRRMRERKIKRLYKSMLRDNWLFELPTWNTYSSWRCSEREDIYKEIWDKAVRMANAPAFCNKECCANPRRYWKGSDFYTKTMQEKINKDSYKQQIKELDDE